jgi:hypothetical protein
VKYFAAVVEVPPKLVLKYSQLWVRSVSPYLEMVLTVELLHVYVHPSLLQVVRSVARFLLSRVEPFIAADHDIAFLVDFDAVGYPFTRLSETI